MRCRPGGGDGASCQRCVRKSLDCVYRDHRRGRKPGTKSVASPAFKTMLPIDLLNRISKIKTPSSTSILTPLRPEQAESDDVISAVTPQAQTVEKGTDWETGTLQPSGLLNHVATEGRFSLQSILSPQGSSASDALNENVTSSFSPEDPVQLGHINLSIAESLFDKYGYNKHHNWIDTNKASVSSRC